MITKRLLQLSASLLLAASASSCSMFGSSKANPSTNPHAMEEFDAASGMWVPAKKVAVPAPAPQNEVLAPAAQKEKSEGGMLKKVGNVVKKPLTWLPWHKSEAEQSAADAAEAAKAPKAKPASATQQ
jgi:hypothetical protein